MEVRNTQFLPLSSIQTCYRMQEENYDLSFLLAAKQSITYKMWKSLYTYILQPEHQTKSTLAEAFVKFTSPSSLSTTHHVKYFLISTHHVKYARAENEMTRNKIRTET